ncbi:hypothetical protein K438DRAFT_1988147 [Mycena galopus ATCC 62051]|nr:hypothetical protein K438DRAFT_1988147 [Mycena galopus ATCC 62051]
MDPLHPPVYRVINTTLTPVFVPTPQSALAIESYFGMTGPGFTAAFLYNPLDPKSGIIINDQGWLAPVLEARWQEFERAVEGAQLALQNTWGVESWWSRPQNTTCPTDMFYDLGPPAVTESLVRFGLSGHIVSSRWGGGPDDVQWHTPAHIVKVVDFVPPPFVEVERIIRNLTEELLPWDWFQPALPVPADLHAMLRAIATMARIKRWRRLPLEIS